MVIAMPFHRFVILALLACLTGLLVGCASTDPDRESDLPWNMPQSWEGSPSIPGLSN